MFFSTLLSAEQQLPPEGRAFALGSILVVGLLALVALGTIVALRGVLVPRGSKPSADPNSPLPAADLSAWKLAGDRIEPLPSPGANDETRGLGEDNGAVDDDNYG
jgi:hypothetical protein